MPVYEGKARDGLDFDGWSVQPPSSPLPIRSPYREICQLIPCPVARLSHSHARGRVHDRLQQVGLPISRTVSAWRTSRAK